MNIIAILEKRLRSEAATTVDGSLKHIIYHNVMAHVILYSTFNMASMGDVHETQLIDAVKRLGRSVNGTKQNDLLTLHFSIKCHTGGYFYS